MIKGHQKVMLQFSGGKDSLACLQYLHPWWDQLDVVWCNAGDTFPETYDLMETVRHMVPSFIEVYSDQRKQIKASGYPSDTLSAWDTPYGRGFEERKHRLQTPFACCGDNIWAPLAQLVTAGGYSLVIRGQRSEELRKNSIRSGHMEAGVTYWFPLENWTKEAVETYLKEAGIPLPEHYHYTQTSLDCQHCTAFLSENTGKMRYLKEHHPQVASEVAFRLDYIKNAVSTEMNHLETARASLEH